MREILAALRLEWRLFWGVCPECGWKWPAITSCPVCMGIRYPVMPAKELTLRLRYWKHLGRGSK
jgi:hypothetical protein